jgi:hypothetical protein
MYSTFDPATCRRTAFRTAVNCFGEAGYTVGLFQPPAAHRCPTFSAYDLTGIICQVLLNADLLTEGHLVNFPVDLRQGRRRPEMHDAAHLNDVKRRRHWNGQRNPPDGSQKSKAVCRVVDTIEKCSAVRGRKRGAIRHPVAFKRAL